MKKSFTTSIEETIINEFKASCAKEGLPMNKVMEILMKAYTGGQFRIEINSFHEKSIDGE